MKILVAALVALSFSPGLAQALGPRAGTPARDRLAWKKATADCLHFEGCNHLRMLWKIDTRGHRCTAYAFKYNTKNQGPKDSGYILC